MPTQGRPPPPVPSACLYLEGLDAVELAEELVDDAVGDAGRVVAAARGQRVEFVKEDDARPAARRALEEVARKKRIHRSKKRLLITLIF